MTYAEELCAMLSAMRGSIAGHKDYLTELDSAIGDADHGINMERGFSAVEAKLPSLEGACCGTILKTAGMALLSTVGGASGPLYGTAFMYAGNVLMGKREFGAEDAAKAMDEAVKGVIKRGNAAAGDKTMVDVLLPVSAFMCSEAFLKMTGPDAAAEVERIAEEAMQSTEGMKANRGRASFLAERSVGHLDPGAVSSYLLISAACRLVSGGGR